MKRRMSTDSTWQTRRPRRTGPWPEAWRRRAPGHGAPHRAVRASLFAAAPLVLACSSSPSSVQMTELAMGTWGGEDVGVVVSDTTAHVHVGCTKGDFPAPIALDQDQRFSVSGSYLIKAYPVAIGPTMPAEFTGVVEGNALTFTVAVNDTIEQKLEVLGPVTAILGQEPEMGPCPICESPGAELARPGLWARLLQWIVAVF